MSKRSTFAFFMMLGAALLLNNASAWALTYQNAAHGYSLETPKDWVQIPDDIFQKVMASTLNPNSKIVQDAGFQAPSPNWFAYPYVLVQPIALPHQINEKHWAETLQAMTGADVKRELNNQLSTTAKDALVKANPNVPILDAPNRRYLMAITSEVKGIGPVRGLAIGHFGRDSIVQTMFYTRAEDWDRYETERKQFMNSFHFTPEKEYSEEIASSESPSFSSSIISGMIEGGVGALIVLAIVYWRNRKTTAPTK